MSTRSQSYRELFNFAQELRDALAKRGKVKEAQELTELLNVCWSIASEALGDFLVSFNSIRNTVVSGLPDELSRRLDLAIQQIEEAFDQANNPPNPLLR